MFPWTWLSGPAHRFAAVGLIAATSAATFSCTILAEAEREQCATDADCRKRGGAFSEAVCSDSVCVADPTWGCLGKVNWPAPATGGRVTAKLILSDLITNASVPDATARVCGKLDPSCANPIASDVRGDSQGVLAVDLDRHFDGFLEIYATGMVSPTLYFFYPPVDEDVTVPFLPLIPPTAISVFGDQLKMPPRLDRGTVIVLGYDCKKTSARGLQLSTDEGDEFTVPFYMQKGLPSLTSTETDDSGQGGLANVPPGIRRISGLRSQNGARVGTVSVVVRAPLITFTSMLPTPN